MEQDKVYVCKHLRGPIINGVTTAIYTFLHQRARLITDYLNKLSINTANQFHLKFLSKLMGLPEIVYAPGAPGFNPLHYYTDSNSTANFRYNDGFSGEFVNAQGTTDAGLAAETVADSTGTLSADELRRVLLSLKDIETNSDNLLTIDLFVNLVCESSDYTFEYDEDYVDVLHIILGSTIDAAHAGLLQEVMPQVFIGAISIIIDTSN